jgi:hypothetical protein
MISCAVTVNVVAREREMDKLGEWPCVMNFHE